MSIFYFLFLVGCWLNSHESFKVALNINKIKSSNCNPNLDKLLTLHLLSNDADDTKISYNDDLPRKIGIKSLEEVSKNTQTPGTFANDAVEITSRASATFGSMSIEDLKGRMVTKEPKPMWPAAKTVDLNGINPATPLMFCIVPAAMCYGGWLATNYLSLHFAVNYLTSDFYPVQRIAIVARNLIVGIFMLGTGFSGFVSVGLFILGMTIAFGTINGTLNPNFSKNESGENKL